VHKADHHRRPCASSDRSRKHFHTFFFLNRCRSASHALLLQRLRSSLQSVIREEIRFAANICIALFHVSDQTKILEARICRGWTA